MNCFFSGTESHPVHVDVLPKARIGQTKPPIIMLHGGFHTGAAWLATPDGRPGWARYFAQQGHDVYVPDWPGHGRSPSPAPLEQLSTRQVADAIAVLVAQVGPAVLLAHSAAGPVAWWIAEQFPASVLAVVGIAPGPPANLLEALPDDPAVVESLRFDSTHGCPVYSPLDAPTVADATFIREFWANSPRFPKASIATYARSIVPESSRLLNERFNIGGRGLRLLDPEVVRAKPILIVTGDHDLRHPKAVDGRLAEYLAADFVWLPDAGVAGNGHMLMIEENSDDIAGIVNAWLTTQGACEWTQQG
ncbi:MAG TPA: alpha/beta fold hydrolase [Burkholderiaceae bacterium]|nr:alpha/beta fold hydrolase [Burkholderiaceae bacterium]